MLTVVTIGNAANAQNLPETGRPGIALSLDNIDSMVVQNSLSIKSSQLEIESAQAQIQQAKLFENPEVQIMHNIKNPLNKKWFDTGHDAETDIQITQPIAICGQHTSKVKLAVSNAEAIKAGHDLSIFETKTEARLAFIDLYNIQQKKKIYDQEISSVAKILQAYKQQTEQGNVSKMQTFRISTMLSQLKSELSELILSENEVQSQLRTILNIQDNTPIEAQMDEGSTLYEIKRKIEQAHPFDSQLGSAFLASAIDNYPAIRQIRHLQQSAINQVKAEKADALPHISLMGEWDKNGSIGHNFFAFGANISIPIWNRNQGNIKQAKTAIKQAEIERNIREKALMESIKRDYHAMAMNLKTVNEQKQMLSDDLNNLLQAAENQFLKRNISIVEFVDLYGSYRETKFQMFDAKAQLWKSHEQLKKDLANN